LGVLYSVLIEFFLFDPTKRKYQRLLSFLTSSNNNDAVATGDAPFGMSRRILIFFLSKSVCCHYCCCLLLHMQKEHSREKTKIATNRCYLGRLQADRPKGQFFLDVLPNDRMRYI